MYANQSGVTVPRTSTTPYGRAALESITEAILEAPTGERHRAAFIAGLKAGSLVAGRQINETEAHTALVWAAEERGLARTDAERQVSRGMTFGAQQPKTAPNVQQVRPGEAREQAVAWTQAVWASDLDPSKKALLVAIGRWCIEHGRIETTQSFRQAAELAGLAVSTVHRLADELGGWVRIIRGGHGPKASTKWRLRPRQAPTALVPIPTASPSENQFHRRKGEWVALSLIDPEEPTTPAELARASGRSLRTIAHYVRRWVAAGIAVVTASGVVAVVGAGFISTEVDHRERRRRRHLLDRMGYQVRRARAWAEREALRTASEPEKRRITTVKGAMRLRDQGERYERRKARQAIPLEPTRPPAFGAYTVRSTSVLPGEVA